MPRQKAKLCALYAISIEFGAHCRTGSDVFFIKDIEARFALICDPKLIRAL